MMLTSPLEPEFIGGEVDLRVNICRGQIVVDDPKQSLNDPKQRLGNYENDLKIRVIETHFQRLKITHGALSVELSVSVAVNQAYSDKLTAEGIIAGEGTMRVSKWVILVTAHGL